MKYQLKRLFEGHDPQVKLKKNTHQPKKNEKRHCMQLIQSPPFLLPISFQSVKLKPHIDAKNKKINNIRNLQRCFLQPLKHSPIQSLHQKTQKQSDHLFLLLQQRYVTMLPFFFFLLLSFSISQALPPPRGMILDTMSKDFSYIHLNVRYSMLNIVINPLIRHLSISH